MNNSASKDQPRRQNLNAATGWNLTTLEMEAFFKYVSPIHRRASSENQIDTFLELLKPVWFDRFPVILLDGFDDDQGAVDPDRQQFYEKKTFKAGGIGSTIIGRNYSPFRPIVKSE
ncbi:hypothetical protein C0992_000363 [Termitomyces sp. T32_za158]|nr:hypothetical protein C0992_000363 [Termitomyces sp. T32_za158]